MVQCFQGRQNKVQDKGRHNGGKKTERRTAAMGATTVGKRVTTAVETTRVEERGATIV